VISRPGYRQGLSANRSRGGVQFVVQCGQKQHSALRESDRPPRKVRVGSGRPDATCRCRRGRRYARPWRCPDAPDRRGRHGETRHRSAAADGDGWTIGNLQPPKGGHDRAFVNHPANTARVASVVSSPYITRALLNYRGQAHGRPSSRKAFHSVQSKWPSLLCSARARIR
jgi:hypothetical protein